MLHHYAVLGVDPGADRATIESAYARLLGQYPADRFPEQFTKILAAYEAVKDAAPITAAPSNTGAPFRLSSHESPGELQARFETMFEEKRFGEIWAELSTPRFVEVARADRVLAEVALRAIGALVWHVPAAIQHVQPFSNLPAEYNLGPLLQHVQIEAQIAARWNDAMSRGMLWDGSVLPETLVNLVGEPLLATPARRRRTFEEVHRLLAEPFRILDAIDRMVAIDPMLVRMVLDRLRGESPLWGPSALAPLPDDVRDRLRHLMVGIRKRSVTRYFQTPIIVCLAIIGVVLGILVATKIGVDGENGDTVINLALIVGGVPAVTFLAIRDKIAKKEWQRWMRREVAGVIAHLGIQADVVSAWLRNSPRLAGRMKLHIMPIENDLGLMTLGAISAIAQEHARKTRA